MTYTVDQARAIIESERCVVGGRALCLTHDTPMIDGDEHCDINLDGTWTFPLFDVAAELLAIVEQVTALADEWATHPNWGAIPYANALREALTPKGD